MDITWYGHSCFRLTERSIATVVTDPFDSDAIGYNPLKLRGDVVTISHDSPAHNFIDAVRKPEHVLTGPGEYEIGGVFITAVPTHSRKKNGKRNVIYVFDYDGITVAHLGDLDRTLKQTEVDALGTVNIALVPVGGGGGLNAAKASEVISMLEPGIVVPMHYKTKDSHVSLDPLSKFLKEMGIPEAAPEPVLKVRSTSIPEETQVVVLDYAA
jgi:L-ascorbate metabolism protein UlaG (beta-lactamase superfamily)